MNDQVSKANSIAPSVCIILTIIIFILFILLTGDSLKKVSIYKEKLNSLEKEINSIVWLIPNKIEKTQFEQEIIPKISDPNKQAFIKNVYIIDTQQEYYNLNSFTANHEEDILEILKNIAYRSKVFRLKESNNATEIMEKIDKFYSNAWNNLIFLLGVIGSIVTTLLGILYYILNKTNIKVNAETEELATKITDTQNKLETKIKESSKDLRKKTDQLNREVSENSKALEEELKYDIEGLKDEVRTLIGRFELLERDQQEIMEKITKKNLIDNEI